MSVKMPEVIYDPVWGGHSDLVTPDGIIFHNDYGAMSAKDYRDWLLRRVTTPEKGFAHEYNDRFTIAQYVKEGRAACHGGDAWGPGNTRYYGIEIVESYDEQYMKISDADFILNEEMTFRRAAELFHKWGKTPNAKTVKLHKEFSSTSCPHRSWKLHGRSVESVRSHFIARIKYYMALGKTVKQIIDTENGKTVVKPVVESAKATSGIERKYAESAVLYPDRTLHVYDRPSLDGKVIATYYSHEYVKYHTVHIGNGHVWIEYTRGNGGKGYIAIRTYKNGQYGGTWGVIQDNVVKHTPVSVIERSYAENGTFYPNTTIPVYDQPFEHGNKVATYYKGESVTYIKIHLGDGNVWLQYKRSNGQYGYIPCRTYSNGKYGPVWGTIK